MHFVITGIHPKTEKRHKWKIDVEDQHAAREYVQAIGIKDAQIRAIINPNQPALNESGESASGGKASRTSHGRRRKKDPAWPILTLSAAALIGFITTIVLLGYYTELLSIKNREAIIVGTNTSAHIILGLLVGCSAVMLIASIVCLSCLKQNSSDPLFGYVLSGFAILFCCIPTLGWIVALSQ